MHDWAWAAGLFEGEGCISLDPQKNGTKRRLTIAMTDRDVLDTFVAIVGAGRVRERSVSGNRKPCWIWQVDRWVDVERIGRALLPYLHTRRMAKMEDLLLHPPVRGGPNCPQGHPLFGPDADVYIQPRRDRPVCAVCTRDRMRKARAA